MTQQKPQWEENEEFGVIVQKVISRCDNEFSHIDASQIIAYNCTNKERPPGKDKGHSYEMSGTVEPESFTNSKTYFVKMFRNEWEANSDEQKLLLVHSVLCRIDKENSGNVGPLGFARRSHL